MVETIGNRLRAARLQRKISLEDAAHVTKISVARLADLESDIYTNFPNIAYAKGFLLIYSNFLHVDATPHLSAFEDANTFGLDDYQYLSDKPVAQFRVTRRRSGGHYTKRRKRRLVAATLVAAMLTLGGFAWYLTLSFQRLGNLEQLTARQQTPRGNDAPAARQDAPALTTASNSPLTAAPEVAITQTSNALESLAAAMATGDGRAANAESVVSSPSSRLEADREAAAAMFNGTGAPSRLLPAGLTEEGPYVNFVVPADKRPAAEAVTPETVTSPAAVTTASASRPVASRSSATSNRSSRTAGSAGVGAAPRATAVSAANH